MTTTSALPESIAESFGEDLIVKQKPEAFSLPAFAKINLELRVLGHRPDGMHEIRTILQTVSLHDLLTFSLRSDNQVIFECRYKSHYLGESDESGVTDEINRKDVPADNTNIVCKAAELLRRYAIERKLSPDPNQLGATIVLEKQIPSSAGLGGGSSDAAVTLIGLSRLWSLTISKEQLTEIATQLGSDVPFFLSGGKAVGTGTGAIIEPLEDAEESALVNTVSIDHKCFNSHPIKHVLIVSPPVRISTAAAYRMLDISRLTFLTREPGAGKLSVSTSAQDINDSSDESFLNDFEEVILPAYPETIFARDALIKAGAGVARLCGSGSSIYGIFDNKYLLNEARILLKGMTGWSVSECRTVSRIEYKKEFGSCAKFLV